MSIDSINCNIDLTISIPSLKVWVGIVKNLCWLFVPLDIFCLVTPESNWIIQCLLEDLVVVFVLEFVVTLKEMAFHILISNVSIVFLIDSIHFSFLKRICELMCDLAKMTHILEHDRLRCNRLHVVLHMLHDRKLSETHAHLWSNLGRSSQIFC